MYFWYHGAHDVHKMGKRQTFNQTNSKLHLSKKFYLKRIKQHMKNMHDIFRLKSCKINILSATVISQW